MTTATILNESPAARLLRAAGAATDLVARLAAHVTTLARDARRDARTVARESEELWTLLAGRAAQVWGAVRATPRLGRLATEALRILATARVQAAVAAAAGEPGDAHVREAARRVRELCVELRGGVLKIGQLASSRVDLLPRVAIEELALLQDRVPPLPDDAIRAVVEAELGRPLDQVFASFGPALAAASLAQVHEAVLLDGTEVAVKVQVPGIDAVVEADLHALRVFGATCAGLFPGLDVPTTVAELARAIRAELDYTAEADELEAFARRFAGRADVVVPRVHRAASTARVLTMERLHGARLGEFLDGCAARGDEGRRERDGVVGTIVDLFAEQILEHGVFHADPHPGNFLVVPGPGPGPRVALLDFGCVMHLPDGARRAYAALVLAVLGRDAARTSTLFGELGFQGDGDALRQVAELVLAVLAEGADLAAMDPAAQLTRALHLLENNPGVRVPEHFILVGRVLATLGGMVVTYPPTGGLFSLLMWDPLESTCRHASLSIL